MSKSMSKIYHITVKVKLQHKKSKCPLYFLSQKILYLSTYYHQRILLPIPTYIYYLLSYYYSTRRDKTFENNPQ